MFSPNTKFLVVDDVSTMRKIVKRVLSEMGYNNTVEASDGKNAFEMLEAQSAANDPIQFIISDWNMPVMYGIDFLRLCRKNPAYKTIPFILVTAESEPHQILEAAKEGVSDYVVKPFTPQKIKEKIERVFAKLNAAKKVA